MVATGTHQPPLRLTRRGRTVVLMFFVLLASLASGVLFTTASRADNPQTGPAPTVKVERYDTLWGIATRTAPHRDPYAMVAEIRRLNALPGYDIEPGDTLILPRER